MLWIELHGSCIYCHMSIRGITAPTEQQQTDCSEYEEEEEEDLCSWGGRSTNNKPVHHRMEGTVFVDLRLASTYVPAITCLIRTSLLIIVISRYVCFASHA